jgi:hypothetical protein
MADFNLSKLFEGYVTKYANLTNKREQLKEAINEAKELVTQLEKEYSDTYGTVSWITELIEPIAAEMLKDSRLKDRYFDILGPFGLCARTSIHFYRNGVTRETMFKNDNCLSITFVPMDLKNGKVDLEDTATNTSEWKQGSLGEMNGMNHPNTPMKATIKELVDFMFEQEQKGKDAKK